MTSDHNITNIFLKVPLSTHNSTTKNIGSKWLKYLRKRIESKWKCTFIHILYLFAYFSSKVFIWRYKVTWSWNSKVLSVLYRLYRNDPLGSKFLRFFWLLCSALLCSQVWISIWRVIFFCANILLALFFSCCIIALLVTVTR